LKLLLPFARRLLATDWLPLSDGVRLATTVIRPLAGGAARVPAVLLRTPSRAHSASDPTLLLARILAESGYIVAVQECRGRYASEGRFTPFESEARDGRETIDWIAEQDWFDGSLGLVGFGYAGFAAWAALCGAAKHVSAMVVAFGAREPHASFRASTREVPSPSRKACAGEPASASERPWRDAASTWRAVSPSARCATRTG
jgi:putative CocE/NonD family hydrolase